MPLTVSDKLLADAGMTEDEARLEIACLLFDSGKLSLPAAVRWAGCSRTQLEGELLARSISIYRPTADDLETDLAVLISHG